MSHKLQPNFNQNHKFHIQNYSIFSPFSIKVNKQCEIMIGTKLKKSVMTKLIMHNWTKENYKYSWIVNSSNTKCFNNKMWATKMVKKKHFCKITVHTSFIRSEMVLLASQRTKLKKSSHNYWQYYFNKVEKPISRFIGRCRLANKHKTKKKKRDNIIKSDFTSTISINELIGCCCLIALYSHLVVFEREKVCWSTSTRIETKTNK